MRECGILFAVWGILISLVGIYVYCGHNDIYPKMYSVPKDKDYLKYLGKRIIIAGLIIVLVSIVLIFI